MSLVRILREGYRSMRFSLVLSVLGTTAEGIIMALYPNMILVTDFVHWTIDTGVEAVSTISLHLASKRRIRFHWDLFLLESMLLLFVVFVVASFYLYSFVDYIVHAVAAFSSNQLHNAEANIFQLAATLSGGAITGAVLFIQKKNYDKLRLEILRVDYIHALIDLVAAAVASSGIVAVMLTRSYLAELVFTIMLFSFVIHGIIGIGQEVLRSALGLNYDHQLEKELLKELRDIATDKARIVDVHARKLGSFYVIEVKVQVSPTATLRELHSMRTRITKYIQSRNPLAYHVDVVFIPRGAVKAPKKTRRV